MKKFVFLFSQTHIDFRQAELESICSLSSISCKNLTFLNQQHVYVFEFPSVDSVQKILSRSVLVKCATEWIATAIEYNELYAKIANKKYELSKYDSFDQSFAIRIRTIGKKRSWQINQNTIIGIGQAIGFVNAPVDLDAPYNTFIVIEEYDSDLLQNLYFGKLIGFGQGQLKNHYALAKRCYIGNTTMDPELSFIQANIAKADNGSLILDPFCGTGGLLLAAAHFGASVLGSEINYQIAKAIGKSSRAGVIHITADESVARNFVQYGTDHCFMGLVIADASQHELWHPGTNPHPVFDAIITDPPYGVREKGQRVAIKGKKESWVVKDASCASHYPEKTKYSISSTFLDLMDLASKLLVIGGRLLFWFPVFDVEYSGDILPTHNALKLMYNCEQSMSRRYSRRLLTYEKVRAASDGERAYVQKDCYGELTFRQRVFFRIVEQDIRRWISFAIINFLTFCRVGKVVCGDWQMSSLRCTPAMIQVPCTGGTTVHILEAVGTERLAFKVKLKPKYYGLYTVSPPFGFVKPGIKKELQLHRMPGKPGKTKLVLEYIASPSGYDPRKPFIPGADVGILKLRVRAYKDKALPQERPTLMGKIVTREGQKFTPSPNVSDAKIEAELEALCKDKERSAQAMKALSKEKDEKEDSLTTTEEGRMNEEKCPDFDRYMLAQDRNAGNKGADSSGVGAAYDNAMVGETAVESSELKGKTKTETTSSSKASAEKGTQKKSGEKITAGKGTKGGTGEKINVEKGTKKEVGEKMSKEKGGQGGANEKINVGKETGAKPDVENDAKAEAGAKAKVEKEDVDARETQDSKGAPTTNTVQIVVPNLWKDINMDMVQKSNEQMKSAVEMVINENKRLEEVISQMMKEITFLREALLSTALKLSSSVAGSIAGGSTPAASSNDVKDALVQPKSGSSTKSVPSSVKNLVGAKVGDKGGVANTAELGATDSGAKSMTPHVAAGGKDYDSKTVKIGGPATGGSGAKGGTEQSVALGTTGAGAEVDAYLSVMVAAGGPTAGIKQGGSASTSGGSNILQEFSLYAPAGGPLGVRSGYAMGVPTVPKDTAKDIKFAFGSTTDQLGSASKAGGGGSGGYSGGASSGGGGGGYSGGTSGGSTNTGGANGKYTSSVYL